MLALAGTIYNNYQMITMLLNNSQIPQYRTALCYAIALMIGEVAPYILTFWKNRWDSIISNPAGSSLALSFIANEILANFIYSNGGKSKAGIICKAAGGGDLFRLLHKLLTSNVLCQSGVN
jgi:hypothetical protein